MSDNVLYISDLDGTLLNANAELSEYTINTLNEIISGGGFFTVATARSAASAIPMLERVNINIPIILMNGVLVYDIAAKKYIRKEYLTDSAIERILGALKTCGQGAFMYSIKDDTLYTYYEKLDSDAMREFYESRVELYGKRFDKTDDFGGTDVGEVVYFTIIDTYERVCRMHDLVTAHPTIRAEMYSDIYSEDMWYLEIFSHTASKQTAAEFLRKYGKFDKLVGFGDNLNDIPLMRACDEFYAVQNAKDAVKDCATAVIASNEQDGVARWLAENVMHS